MIRRQAIRQLLRAHETAHQNNLRDARQAFVQEMLGEVLGLEVGDNGSMRIRSGSIKPDEFSIRDLADEICGRDFVEEFYAPVTGFEAGSRVLEAAIDPGNFINVSTFNVTVGGLVNAMILDHFINAAFIGDQLVDVKPTTKNGEKFIGTTLLNAAGSPIGATATKRRPGEPHPEAQFSDVYVQSPETVEQALKVVLTREAVFFDLTNQVLETAAQQGEALGYIRERAIIDGTIGVTNSYNRNGTSYNTYQTSSPWINSFTNTFTDWSSVDNALQKYSQMTDPDTGREILVQPSTILCMPAKRLITMHMLEATQVSENTNNTAGNFPARYAVGPNPLNRAGVPLQVLSSPIVRSRAIAADGLNLSAANADVRWWISDFKKAFYWMENWPLTTWQATPDESVMKDRGLAGMYGGNYRGVHFTREPRQTMVCTH